MWPHHLMKIKLSNIKDYLTSAVFTGFVLTTSQFVHSFVHLRASHPETQNIISTYFYGYKEALKQWVTLSAIAFFAVLILDAAWDWVERYISSSKIKNKHGFKTGIACLIWLALTSYGGWLLNHFFLPGIFDLQSILVDVWFSLFTLFLLAGFIKRFKRSLILTVTLVFIAGYSFLLHPGHKQLRRQAASTSCVGATDEDRLASFPYASWTKTDDKRTGVTIYDRARAYNGINLYQSSGLHGARLLDMQGNILHSLLEKRGKSLKLIKPYHGTDFVVLKGAVYRLSWDSSVFIEIADRSTHDVSFTESGKLYTIDWSGKRYSPRFRLMEPINDEHIVIRDKTGAIRKKISMARAIARSRACSGIISAQRKWYDPRKVTSDAIYVNSIHVLERDVYKGNRKMFDKGDILLSMRNLDTIAIMDGGTDRIVWTWGTGIIERPHHPTMLENGNILIYDNGYRRRFTRVVEVDPEIKEIVWEYKGSPPGSFFSREMGSAQRLPNGNTLIAESEKGRVFEVTKEGDIVWEFYNPKMSADKKSRGTIYRMIRLMDMDRYPLLQLK